MRCLKELCEECAAFSGNCVGRIGIRKHLLKPLETAIDAFDGEPTRQEAVALRCVPGAASTLE